MNNRRGIMFVVIGLVAAIAAGIVVYALSLSVVQTTGEAAGPQPTPAGKDIIVAARDIAPSTAITNSMVVTATYPENLVPPDAVTTVSQVVGKTSKLSMLGGQVLLQRQFLDTGGRTGTSAVVPKGKVLVAFPSTDILNSTGVIQAGDHVDILLSIPISGTTRIDQGTGTGSQISSGSTLVSQTTIQNVEVSNIGPAGTGQTNGPKLITFLVDHQEALILKYIKDGGGTIDMVVRSFEDGENVATDPVNIDYLVDLYKFIGLPTKK